jgi:serine/threonine-protein kinase
MLSLKLLGGASVERSGLPEAGRAARGHRLALLALLARGRPLSRDKVLALLWPESDTDRGRRMLSDTLYLLRGAFGEDVVLAAGDDLRLNPDRATSDAAEFERLADEGRPEPAVRAYAGPFLDGFHLADSAEFEQWADTERARLARRYAEALEALAAAREGEGDWSAAAGWWRRLAALEPGNGRIALRLMHALDASGDRAGALGHARVHAAMLKEEFDAEPDPEIVRLTERLRREPAARATGPVREARRPPEQDAAGGRDQTGVAPPALAPRRSFRPRVAAAVGLAALAIAGVVFAGRRDGGARPASSATAPARRSIAVMPFANLSADRTQDYFSDGLTEELIGVLSRIEGLRVAARTSSFAVGGGRLDVRTIGDTLGVATVLEGSVRQDGRRLRVSARLADAASGYQIWADEYDRELKDVLALQDEIARAIAGALEMRLAGGNRTGTAPRRVPSVEAHDLYLRGVFVRNQLTSDGLSKAVDYFDRAIQLDSGYALAYAGKATAIGPLVWYGYLPRAQGMPAMRAAARRALHLDPTLGEAHAAQGMLEFYFEWNWPAAEREFRRALALNPSDQHAHHMYANYLLAMGRFDEALAERSRALELDPLSIRTGILLARDYLAAGRYDDAIAQYGRMAEIDSTSPLALGVGQEGSFGLGDVYERRGRDAEAIEEYLRGARLEGIPGDEIGRLRQAYDVGGLAGYWRRRLELELGDTGSAPEPLRIASLYARVGDAERTAEWVERAYRERSMALPFLGVLPIYQEMRSHPRIAVILDRMKLPRGQS